ASYKLDCIGKTRSLKPCIAMLSSATANASKDKSKASTSAPGNAWAQAMAIQPLPVHKSRIRFGALDSQGVNCLSINSAMGERGTNTRSSTTKGKPAKYAFPVK